MSLILQGSTSGSITLQEPAVAGTTVLDLPAVSGTILTTASSGQSIPKAALPTGSVLQVVQGTYSTQVTVTGTTYTDSGLSASITPTSSSSKILVLVVQAINISSSQNYALGGIRLLRGSTTILDPNIADGTGPYGFGTQATGVTTNRLQNFVALNYLDSPATTSSTTYKTQGRPYQSGFSLQMQPSDSTIGTSSITLMEIAA